MPKVKTLQEWQPKAQNIMSAGTCHECKQKTMLFYQLHLDPVKAPDGWLQGGFYCENCGWGNAGAINPLDLPT